MLNAQMPGSHLNGSGLSTTEKHHLYARLLEESYPQTISHIETFVDLAILSIEESTVG
jgi:hypothetical protein